MPHEPRRAIEEREVDAEAPAPEFVGRAQQRCEQQSAPLTPPDHQPSELGGRQEFDVREPLHRGYVEVPRRHLARLPVPDAEHAGDAVLVACEEVQRVRLVILGVVHPRSVAVVTTEVAAQLLDVDAVPETPQLSTTSPLPVAAASGSSRTARTPRLVFRPHLRWTTST